MFYSQRPVVENKTAAYTLTAQDEGKILTNLGASGSVTFTLPPVTNLPTGWSVRFYGLADQAIVIASNGSSDNIAAFNDVGADSLTSTTGEFIGVGFHMVWLGTKWANFQTGAEAVTVTIA